MRKGFPFFVGLVFSFVSLAADWEWSLNIDSFAAWEDETLLGLGRTTFLERVRFNLDSDLSEGFSLDFGYELDAFLREGIGVIPGQILFSGQTVYLRRDDLKTRISVQDDAVVLQNLDRFSVSYSRGRGVLTVGRQAIGHGNGRFFSPSDLFTPLSGTSLNTQYKTGIDGVYYAQGFGDDSEWAAMFFFPESGDGLSLFRLVTLVGNVDLSFLVGDSYGETTLAWDVAGSWLGAAIYTEGVWRRGKDREDPWRLAAGFNRRFGGKWDVTMEGQYNSLATVDPQEILRSPELRAGELIWLAEFTAAANLSFELTPLIRLDSSLIWESDNDSSWFQSGISWDVSNRASLAFGVLATRGDSQSELGRFGETLFVEYRLTLP